MMILCSGNDYSFSCITAFRKLQDRCEPETDRAAPHIAPQKAVKKFCA